MSPGPAVFATISRALSMRLPHVYILLFFVGFLPLFINLQTARFTELLTASIVIVVTFIVTLSIYALGAAYVKKWLQGEPVMLWLHRAAGILMCGVGVAVILR